MKTVIEMTKIVIFSIIFLALMFYGFFGAVLQTSYRLCPLEAAEVVK